MEPVPKHSVVWNWNTLYSLKIAALLWRCRWWQEGCVQLQNQPEFDGSLSLGEIGFSSSGLTDESAAQRSTFPSTAIYVLQGSCVESECPWARRRVAKVEADETEGEAGIRREADGRPRDESCSPKHTQISCALLRRQGAEHRVLVDATKPIKTTLQPRMYSPPSPYHPSCHWHTPFTLTLARGDPTLTLRAGSRSAHLRDINGLMTLNQFLFIMIKCNNGLDFFFSKALGMSSNASSHCK